MTRRQIQIWLALYGPYHGVMVLFAPLAATAIEHTVHAMMKAAK